MPRVPVYDGPQVRTQALPGAFQTGASSAAPFGAVDGQQMANLGQGMQQAAEGLDRVALRKEQDDAFRVETAVKAEWLKFEENLRRRRGRDAEGISAEAEAWWEEAKTRHAGNLTPRAQMLINRSLGQARVSGLAAIGRFREQELERSADESTVGAIGVEIQRAGTTGDPKEVDVARNIIRDHLAAMGARKGWDSNRLSLETLRYTDMLHKRMIETLVDSNPKAAKEYFEANRSEIDANHHSRIQQSVNRAFNEDEGERIANGMIAMPYEEQVKRASEIKDTELRVIVTQRVKANAETRRIAQAERERAASDTIWQQISQGVPFAKLPKSVLDQMDGRERLEVTKHYEAERKARLAAAEGRSVKTDFGLYAQLRELPREEFLKLRLSTFVDRIAGPQMEQLLDLQNTYRKPEKVPEAVSMEQQGAAAITRFNLREEKKGQFQSAYYAEVQAHTRRTGKEPTFEEREKIIDRLMMEGEVRSGAWYMNDPNRRLFETTADERARWQPNISREDRKAIVESYSRQGITRPTEAQILQAFRTARGL